MAGTGGASEALSDEDLEAVMEDIELAHAALVGVRAGNFITELMEWPGVKEAIEQFGGWGLTEGRCVLLGLFPDFHL